MSKTTDRDSNLIQKFCDEIQKRDAEALKDREAIELRDAEIERLKAELMNYKPEHVTENPQNFDGVIGHTIDYSRLYKAQGDGLLFANDRNKSLTTENYTLRAQIDKQEQQLQAYETQITLQEDGPSSLLERLERQKRDLDYYASEVERLKAIGNTQRVLWQEERDFIKTGLENTIIKMNSRGKENDTLKARVEELETTAAEYAKATGHGKESVAFLKQQIEKLEDELEDERSECLDWHNDAKRAEARIEKLEELVNYCQKQYLDGTNSRFSAIRERDSLREQLAGMEEMYNELYTHHHEAIAHDEPAKPSVVESYVDATLDKLSNAVWGLSTNRPHQQATLKLIFRDGKLFSSEVLRD